LNKKSIALTFSIKNYEHAKDEFERRQNINVKRTDIVHTNLPGNEPQRQGFGVYLEKVGT